MKRFRRICVLVLSVLLLCSLLCFGASAATLEYVDADGKTVKLDDFLDTKGHWAHDVILRWADYGVVNGHNGNFRPDGNITRGDLALVLTRVLGLKDTTYNYFTDLDSSAYYADAVLKCVAYGYMNGISSTEMAPSGYATREHMAALVCRVFHLDLVDKSYAEVFSDHESIAAWAKPYVATCYKLGYMTGHDGRFDPKQNLTRAELIQVLANVGTTFIPKKGTNETVFKDNFPRNILTGKAITLTKSTVGRDVFVTTDAGTFTMENTTIAGRLVLMGRTTVNIEDSSVSQIVMLNGKSTVTGITSDTPYVYVAYDATESSLDELPEVLVLESGARVRIDGVVYENDSLSAKTYYGVEIKGDIAAEQGYVAGGAKVSGTKFTQSVENVVTVSKVNIKQGDAPIQEVGVVWVWQDADENDVLPTYQNCDGRMRYNSDKFDTTLSFKVGTVTKTCTYRLYVLDTDGLFAYSDVETFTAYDFDVSMFISDTANGDYPSKVSVAVTIDGSNIPEISSVKATYNTSASYTGTLPVVSLKEASSSGYLRYTGTITSTAKVNDVVVPPTYFGYIITFDDGTVWNSFPVLKNKMPSGAKPVASIKLGNASVRTATTLSVSNSSIVAGYAGVSEAGLMYYVGTSQPSLTSTKWTKVDALEGLGVGESYVFDSVIPLPADATSKTYFVLYARTTNGYTYSDVSYYDGTWLGDEGAGRLKTSSVTVLNTTTAVVMLQTTGGEDIDPTQPLIMSATCNGKSDTSLVGKKLSDFTYFVSDPVDGVRTIYVFLEGLTAKASYVLGVHLQDDAELKTNMSTVTFSTTLDRLMALTLGDRYDSAYPGWSAFDVTFGNSAVRLANTGSIIYGDVDGVASVMTTDGSSRAQKTVYVSGVDDYTTTIVDLVCVYTVPTTKVSVSFVRAVHLG